MVRRRAHSYRRCSDRRSLSTVVEEDSELKSLEAARQHRRGVRAAMGGVEAAVSSAATGREKEWALYLSGRLSELLKAFRFHVEATEAPDGLFAEIMADAPRLARRVAQLVEEHKSIAESIQGAVKTASPDGAVDEVWVSVARQGALAVLGEIARHRHLGADLVYEAYSVDVEAAD